MTRRGAGRPPATANAPAQPPSGEREQEARPRKEDEDRDRRRRANRGEDRDGKDPDYQASRTLALAPVCCGCTRQGVAELAFPEEVSEATFKTRPTKPSGSTFIGLCLMPNPHGTLSRGTERICGHTPCARCLLRAEGVLMCPCCADRTEARESPLGGTGPLPDEGGRPRHSRPPAEEAAGSGPVPPAPGAKRPAEPAGPPPSRRPAPARCWVGDCIRLARTSDGACCRICEGGRATVHTEKCDARARRDGTLEEDTEEDEEDDDGGPDRDRRGEGPRRGDKRGRSPDRRDKGAGKKRQRPDKAQRDRRKQKGGGKGKRALDIEKFRAAMAQGFALSTIKSHQARLRTWDRAREELARLGVLSQSTEPAGTTPEEVRAVAAYLKAKGYRSGELYVNTAVARHRAAFGVSPRLGEAARVAQRLARRGRGPRRGRAPCPPPREGGEGHSAILTGIYYLLRGGELLNLRLQDVGHRHCKGAWQVTLLLRESKTDQEGSGEVVGRECTCPTIGQMRWCPAHTLWNHLSRRARELEAQAIGPELAQEAPLFVSTEGQPAARADLQGWIESAAASNGEPLRGADGKARYGTHSLRVAGAFVAFAGGAPEETVRSLGRWKTTTVMLAYLRGAPVVRAAGASHDMARVMTGAWNKEADGAPTHVAPLLREVGVVGRRPGPPADGLRVMQGLTGKVHRPLIASGPPATWITVCGW